MTADLVSVVVPARDEGQHIDGCLRSILDQDWPSLEVLVVDGGSSDGTREKVHAISSRDPRVRLVSNPKGIIPAALNIALAHARSRWLVRVDAHASIPKDYVRIARELLATNEYGAVGGRKNGQGVTPAGRAIAAVMGSRFGVGGSTYHFGNQATDVDHVPFGAYPVALVRALGGWNEQLRVNQDFELDYRVRKAGYRIRFDPRMAIQWESRQSIRDLARQYYRYGRGKVQVAALHPASVNPRHIIPPTLVLGLAAAAVTAWRRPRLSALIAAPYGLVLAAGAITIGKRVDPEARPYIVPAMLAMHLSWGAGFWRGLGDVARRWGPRGRTQP
ncbi:MAG TPA: glycosyltransferase family 2 protein [Actinomycetes bacterium]|nr:glycosyltransferase family 2 protein [Actinomycetes bacterium]